MNKEKNSLIEGNKKCTGCGACENICQVDAIQLDYDQAGFLKPVVKEDACVACGQCISVCPTINSTSTVQNEDPVCYAAWARDEIRMDSSSGGVFSVLAEKILDREELFLVQFWIQT